MMTLKYYLYSITAYTVSY